LSYPLQNGKKFSALPYYDSLVPAFVNARIEGLSEKQTTRIFFSLDTKTKSLI
jgi:hypothetical protein